MAQFSGAANALGAQGRANQPSRQGGGGVSPAGNRGPTGGGKAGGGTPSVPRTVRSAAPQLTVFEKASRGLPLDDDELAQLSPEQRAFWESQRASTILQAAP